MAIYFIIITVFNSCFFRFRYKPVSSVSVWKSVLRHENHSDLSSSDHLQKPRQKKINPGGEIIQAENGSLSPYFEPRCCGFSSSRSSKYPDCATAALTLRCTQSPGLMTAQLLPALQRSVVPGGVPAEQRSLWPKRTFLWGKETSFTLVVFPLLSLSFFLSLSEPHWWVGGDFSEEKQSSPCRSLS